MDWRGKATGILSALLLAGSTMSTAAMAGGRHHFLTREEAAHALGDLSEIPARDRAYFQIDKAELKRAPGPNDWLANHPEVGQTYRQYVRSGPNMITDTRNVIYIQPLGEFSPEEEKILSAMREFLAVYFQTEAALLGPLPLERGETVWRKNPYMGHQQVLAGSVMENVLLPRLPDDAFCMLGITTVDLYPHPSWNFVFGQASLKGRTGVYSLARYDPAFYGEKMSVDERLKVVLRRALKVAAHETGHMFGLNHCICCECLMNGSNHMGESDARPLILCPVCLRKMYWNRGLDVAGRRHALESFWAKKGLDAQGTDCSGRNAAYGERCTEGEPEKR